ncbi:recombinase family protein, partial [Nostoc sp. HG1]|nr:recombinase family protein [Nostoc sp. HG1]
ARVAAGGIAQVLTESTDRIARHQGDSYQFANSWSFEEHCLIHALGWRGHRNFGTFKGLMDAQFRKELGAKIKRGQRGTVTQGRCPAGLAYGYRTANQIDAQGRPIRGLRSIDEEQATIVRRIYREFGELGLSARTIAARLNAEGVPGPRGSHWRASTINGDASRGNGILRNELYVGRLVSNPHQQRLWIRPPDVFVIRPNAPDQHNSNVVPHLRIVEDDAWEAVRSRQNSFTGLRPERAVRPRRMLSGLGRCGVCGQGWIVIGLDRWGCTKHKADGSCTNARQITTGQYEQRVLAGLREHPTFPGCQKAIDS